MSRSHPWLPWLLVVPMLGGCASLALRPQPASEAAVEVRAEGGRERVTVQQALQQQPSALLYVAAIAGDALLGVNLVRLVLAFQTETAAVQFGLLGAVVGMTGDVLLHRNLAASTDREPHQVRVTTAGGMVLGVALKAAEPGRYEALVALPAGPLRLEVLARDGLTLAETRYASGAPVAIAPDPSGAPVAPVASVEPAAPVAVVAPGPPVPTAVDVDRSLPHPVPVDRDAVALVVGIERYGGKVPPVTFARRDAQAMQAYMRDVFGVEPENQIVLLDDQATKGALQTAFEGRLGSLVEPGKSRVYVYFAGHGAPDVKSKTAFLVPYDGDPQYPAASCYAASAAYEALGRLKAKDVTVMLDACFTGDAARSETPQALLAGARPALIRAKAPNVPRGVAVLAAAGADEISSAYPQMQHGLFTYFLLKALRREDDAPATLTLRTLKDYLAAEVPRRARRMGRQQTPTLQGSGSLDRPLGPGAKP